MTYLQLAYLHLGTVIPAFLLGTYLLLNRKGTSSHKLLGKIYMLLMSVTAILALFMPAQVGPTFLDHFGFIHLLCLLVLYSVPEAFFAIRSGNVKKHRFSMISLYLGALLIAGLFTFMPGRMMHTWFFT